MNIKFLTKTAIISALLLLLIYFISANGWFQFSPAVYPVVIGFGALSYIFGVWIVKSINERPALYVNRFMIGLLVKMMSFLIFIGVYVYMKGENKLEVMLVSLISYIILNINMIIFLKNSEKLNALKTGK